MSKQRSSFWWEDAPDENKFSECVHCGMCLEACPTYQETGLEHHSPRGRVYLIKSAAEGKMELNSFFKEPIDTCLACRACETACPSGVQVGALIEETRGQLFHATPAKGKNRMLQQLFLRHIFPNPNRLRMLGSMTRLYQKSGIQRGARKLKLLRVLPAHLQEMEAALPSLQTAPLLGRGGELFPAYGEKRATVAMITGCVMDVVYSNVNEATLNVLRKNGCDVWIPSSQKCCGALHLHSGDREQAKQLAKHNINVFLSNDVDAIVINAAGCGSTLKEYDELLKNDQEYGDRSHRFAEKTKDISEFLIELGVIPPTGRVDKKVTYHDACHLAHAQGIRQAPRELLNMIPGLEIEVMPESDRCCGSAGIYNITHPEMASQLLDRKLNDIPTGCDAVAMGNPGCMMQFQVGVVKYKRSEQIVHTIELLNEAYENESSKGGTAE
ncbi:(Fe-S)-binding protein [Paenibacillus septentrionalis]|uniref:Glycolate oxidase iron-sulfur subunit n=1 Tax=Paenibacillus septentrionalis TaxID=429342 RepID=A0ABW1VA95_9BACL